MYCASCGKEMTGAFCANCGASQTGAPRAPQAGSQFTPRTAGNGLSTAGIILGAIAFLVFPIIFGPAGLICGAVAKSRGEERAVIAMVVSACGLVIGMIIGAAIGMSQF